MRRDRAGERMKRVGTHIANSLIPRVAERRPPDFVVGADAPGGAYLNRWFLTPWKPLQVRLRDRADADPTWANCAIARIVGWLPNLYLHQFLRDDDDRALHDHPSWAASLILRGEYVEHTIANGGIHNRERMKAGRLRFLSTTHTHRIELLPLWWSLDDFDAACEQHVADPTKRAPCWTLFLFGPAVREWGFHCPIRGWVHWKIFTAAGKPGEVGRGCGA